MTPAINQGVFVYFRSEWGLQVIVKYHITVEDVVALHRHVMNSPTTRKNKFRWILVVMLLLAATLFIPLPEEELIRPVVVAFAVVWGAAFLILVFVVGPALMDRHVRGVYKEGANKGTIGQHEIEIDENGLVERTEVNEARWTWGGIERIEESDTHAFIYVSSVMAHIIPKQSVFAGDPGTFIAKARELWRSANPESGAP